MKQLALISIFSIFNLNLVFGQWLESETISNSSLYEVEFPHPNSAYITGDFGLLYKSTDGGATWNQIYDFGPFSSLNDLNFINEDVGFVSAGGGVFRTLNGGTSWTNISSSFGQPTGLPFDNIKINQQNIYTSYANNDTTYFLKSYDYGTSWSIVFQNYEANAQAYKFSMIDEQNGYFVNPNELSQILRTQNGGQSFLDTIIVQNGPIEIQQKYDFTDLQNGYFYGTSGSSANATRTVTTVNGNFYAPINLDGFGVLPVLDLDFNTSKLYASSLYGKLFVSQNNGQIWVEQTTPVNGYMSSIAFANNEQGIAVCQNKVIYTTNGGVTSLSEFSDIKNSIIIYPNPTKDFLKIDKLLTITIEEIKLYDLQGRLLKYYTKNFSTIDVSQISNGEYLLKIKLKEEIITKKVVISR